jgi:hypothetical protein
MSVNKQAINSDLGDASELLDKFRSSSLKKAVAGIERSLVGLTQERMSQQLSSIVVNLELLLAALLIKRHASQIDNLVHAIGILLAFLIFWNRAKWSIVFRLPPETPGSSST